ncbi:VWA domain-containing protein [Streptomyces sp. 5.8]|uniref:VWA domain-containing protein n=1 Tax=Streptomyces sp. 5.8 TaxID=3406571 RepID=UPI003BB770D5
MPATHSLEKTSAISLDKVAGTAPDLIAMYKDAEKSLRARELIGSRRAVYFLFSRSAPMRHHFESGAVQRLGDQVLSLSAHLDADGKVPVGFFSDEMYTFARRGAFQSRQAFVDALGAHQGRVGELHELLGGTGTPRYRPAMEAVRTHYRASTAYQASIPAFVVFQTDVEPQDEPATRDFLQATAHENVRWQFVPFGAERRFDLLRRLPGNIGVSAAGAHPLALSNIELYNRLVAGLPGT